MRTSSRFLIASSWLPDALLLVVLLEVLLGVLLVFDRVLDLLAAGRSFVLRRLLLLLPLGCCLVLRLALASAGPWFGWPLLRLTFGLVVLRWAWTRPYRRPWLVLLSRRFASFGSLGWSLLLAVSGSLSFGSPDLPSFCRPGLVSFGSPFAVLRLLIALADRPCLSLGSACLRACPCRPCLRPLASALESFAVLAVAHLLGQVSRLVGDLLLALGELVAVEPAGFGLGPFQLLLADDLVELLEQFRRAAAVPP